MGRLITGQNPASAGPLEKELRHPLNEPPFRRVLIGRGADIKTAFVKVFGCRPHHDGATHSGAGVRKPPREETAGVREAPCRGPMGI